MERVGGRTAWLPAHLLWVPAVAAGVWFLFGFDTASANLGGAWSMRVSIESPVGWFEPAWRGWTGAGLLFFGIVMRIAASWQPHPSTVMTVSRYPAFGVAAFLMWALAAAAAVQMTGHVMDANPQGIEWRFIADFRTQLADVLVTWISVGLGLCFYALSFAGAWNGLGRWLPETDAGQHIE